MERCWTAAGIAIPNSSAAVFRPATRFVIFWNATSRAKSGEPWFGFSSIENGEKPQSSVEPRRSLGTNSAGTSGTSGHEIPLPKGRPCP